MIPKASTTPETPVEEVDVPTPEKIQTQSNTKNPTEQVKPSKDPLNGEQEDNS